MQEVINKLRKALIPIYGKGETEAIIRLIFYYVKGWKITDMLIHSREDLSPFVKEEIDKILQRLLKNEPIQYIVGEARFHGLDLKIRPGVLIPRPETEELVDIIIDDYKSKEDLKILDLCTGSGCIAIALSINLPFSEVTAVDISTEAIEMAKENSTLLKRKINLIKEDIFEWDPKENYDIIVSNPPYVMDKEALTMEKNVLDYEPHEALFVRNENPLVFYRRIADIGLNALKDNGRLYFEINPLLADELKEMMKTMGYSDVDLIRDSFGKLRFLRCTRI
ncbi:MAG: peptide chain release factor N(5)-glutamine methyltransferase [Muribaculaceae bacterium]|nr:peptide chain release factor N(5)-glutamine methyltransferase [Muribaculaceae bacterium]